MSIRNTRTSSAKSKKQPAQNSVPGFIHIKSEEPASEYIFKKNGLTVLCIRVPGSPTVTTNIVYRVGSQHEAFGKTGLAHMLEHMLFKPLKDKTKKTWKDLENVGALLNATTWLDRTMYYFNLPADHLEDMLEVEATRMQGVNLTDAEFQPERTNVLSEYEMYYSDPAEALVWNLNATAFQAHGYGHETIGFKADIENYTVEDLENFYRAHYRPNNATLIVVSDIEPQKVLAAASRKFGEIRNGADVQRSYRTVEPLQEGERRISLRRETPLRLVALGYKAPSLLSRDWLALHLALAHLTEGRTSILYKRLVEKNLATEAAYGLYPTRDPFLATLHICLTEGAKYDEVESIVKEEVETLKQTGIPAKRFSELKERVRADEIMGRDGTFNIAAGIAEYVAAGDWKGYYALLDDLAGMKATEVRDAARKYLNTKQLTVGTIENV